MMPKSIVVVGGSLAGLMHALQIKREGHNVIILEQESASERSAYGYGVGYKKNVEEFLRRFDSTGVTVSTPSERLHYAIGRRAGVFEAKKELKLTSWGFLYRVLRANFDGFATTACPTPPQPLEGDGSAEYRGGKEVTNLECADGIVTVHYTDAVNGKPESVKADQVIGADGLHSTVRELVGVQLKKQYAGYVAWRGIIPERSVSTSTREYFAHGTSFNFLWRSYIICYVIPTDEGSFAPEDRLLNWVWYFNVADGSPEMTDIFTDTHGKLHQNTVPRGLVRPEVWDRIRTSYIDRVAPPFAEIFAKTDQPFVSKISDAQCATGQYLDGHVVLVGDALATLRPHTASATEQAAWHSLTMAGARRGEMSLTEWDKQASVYAQQKSLESRLTGEFGQGTTLSFLASVFSYLAFSLRQWLSRG